MERIVLMGAEEVSSAGNRISSAADTMLQAAGSIDDALYRHRMFLDDWLQRFERALEKAGELK